MSEKAPIRILILEDDPGRQLLVRDVFGKIGQSFTVDFAASASQTLIEVAGTDVLFLRPRDRPVELIAALGHGRRSGIVLVLEGTDETEQLQAIRDGLDEWVPDGAEAVKSYPAAAMRALARRRAGCDELDGSLALLRSQKQWMSILDAITDYIFVVDEQHCIKKVNAAFADLLGREPRDVVGRPCSELFCGDLLSEFPVTGPGQADTQRTFEKTIAGETYQISIFPLTENGLTYTIHVLKNTTELKRLKDLLYHAERLASLGQLVSGVAHEINNPLTGTIAYSELLLLRVTEEDIRTDLGKILDSAQRCKRIVDNLLTFSRQRSSARSLESFNALLDRALELRSYALRSNSIEVVRDYSDIGTVFVDAPQVQQALLNILMNAEQALAAGGRPGRRITIRTRIDRERRLVTATIEDNGPGIPDHLLSRIFDPFFTTKPVGVGTGLGLSMAHAIASEHGGTLHAVSSEGGGASFVLELPTGAGSPLPGHAVRESGSIS